MSNTSTDTGSGCTGSTDTIVMDLPGLNADTVPIPPTKGTGPAGKQSSGRGRSYRGSRGSRDLPPPARAARIRMWSLRGGRLVDPAAETCIADALPVVQTSESDGEASVLSRVPQSVVSQKRPRPKPTLWSYQEAFARNLGLISPQEQDRRLRTSHVAIIGMGGVGGIHLTTLARLGIGQFTIADPDTFETANFNRQMGATLQSLGRSKAEVMAQVARSINPEVQLRVFQEAITPENLADFLSGVDVLIDGVDFFNIETRRLVFREAARRGIWAVTAGPIGFSTAWLVFDPNGMSFDDYFDLHDQMDRLDQLIAFAVGLTPRATHVGYLDLGQVDPQAATGPSVSLACRLAGGVAAAETLKILLGRGSIRPVPWYFQFDAYRQVLRKGRLRWGNRHPWQRLKRHVLHNRYTKGPLRTPRADTGLWIPDVILRRCSGWFF